MAHQVTTFYHFTRLDCLAEKQSRWQGLCDRLGLKGTILLAEEGVNATIAGESEAIEEIVKTIAADLGITSLPQRHSWAETTPFQRLKVKIKPEIVSLGLPQVTPEKQVGTYVSPQQWNELLQDPDVVVIDTRNDYEVAIGTFQGAINPRTKRFRQFPDYVKNNLDQQKNKKVAMFCTGGIRCEKASAYLLAEGFSEVYHLQGGILHYLETVSPAESLWQGECFVFDQRVAVQEGLKVGSHALCDGCGYPLSVGERHCPQCGLTVAVSNEL
ncbi:rhodanese-related sulfurtransferase [Synechocystis salina]|uniref:tRNA uridine(34) hydroxylase n=1 Tax=Synechocystis salina LEGE 00031 TaxID=1828736 RepID=A0ABR9VS88_9SYNC|nr:rhodanese-related sulfurtransferase [Synechocystis salina]MBE9241149.1 rhodanese-related sulfurtransferase [Synechocystis salina LEGE 00041]MBE9254219.1 rhodanese-related sulfurtransferase [Synechocystis salina LEGE 00031]